MTDATMPASVTTIWWIGLIVTLLIFVPLAVTLLHRTWQAARSIRRYAEDARAAAGGIASGTVNIAALDSTIAVATDMLTIAGRVVNRLDTIATVVEERAAR